VVEWHHGRVHTRANGAILFVGDGKQLDDVAELLRRGDVVRSDLGDAFAVHVAADDARTERDRRNDRRLRGRVETFDVGRGVALGISQLLCLGDRCRERGTFFGHARQHVVGRAVDDSHHARDAFARERFP